VDFTVVRAGRKQRVAHLQHASPKQAEYLPTLTGNSFGALTDIDATDAPEEQAANSDDALYKAVITSYPDVGAILCRQEHAIAASSNQATTAFTSLMGLITKMDDRLTKLTSSMRRMENCHVDSLKQTLEDHHVESMEKLDARHVASMSQMETRLLAKIDAFNGNLATYVRTSMTMKGVYLPSTSTC